MPESEGKALYTQKQTPECKALEDTLLKIMGCLVLLLIPAKTLESCPALTETRGSPATEFRRVSMKRETKRSLECHILPQVKHELGGGLRIPNVSPLLNPTHSLLP